MKYFKNMDSQAFIYKNALHDNNIMRKQDRDGLTGRVKITQELNLPVNRVRIAKLAKDVKKP